ncbi:Sec-independent protein translocase protein TatB [Marinomonas mediterranea]|uniref:Sec-independent protein translocase protein TatB n=1 Tax=Marinomonas mediterranea (strain ATCC 700492 / JCM 21426 / NBRC 103028 / MMB-1) TaxID=717774 RepID=F2JTS1_MARM1|nr:Sec-independent protein translocase protein TatB [Marinomonas mediterranea]ADZ92691.1 Sec-independent protein translocase protein tatB-like protein [Marinomonas mediterranea MMB-1]WCN10626.1 twin-arginine translocase subunit TatB [Marinomonas mediterranea]WCN14678.1 twin-arginine translocase subunit TatB [Marinomonas mediterranea]WCN18722.1 twin-arginine translocase subunit TatB [Marinomonas mediterranea MMB-1]
MFDIGLSELLVVFVVGLLILGPERLPVAAKTAGLWVRKIRRSVQSVQREINAQLDQEEMQQKIKETNERILKESREIQNTITPLPETQLTESGEPNLVDNVQEAEQPSPSPSAQTTNTLEDSQETTKASNAN